MDTSPTPERSVCLVLEITRAADGRLEGQLRTHARETWKSFSGVLDLLKVLEESLDATEDRHGRTQTQSQPKEGTQS
jgi:hypothetical protein